MFVRRLFFYVYMEDIFLQQQIKNATFFSPEEKQKWQLLLYRLDINQKKFVEQFFEYAQREVKQITTNYLKEINGRYSLMSKKLKLALPKIELYIRNEAEKGDEHQTAERSDSLLNSL